MLFVEYWIGSLMGFKLHCLFINVNILRKSKINLTSKQKLNLNLAVKVSMKDFMECILFLASLCSTTSRLYAQAKYFYFSYLTVFNN
jgi:hypothetical protein